MQQFRLRALLRRRPDSLPRVQARAVDSAGAPIGWPVLRELRWRRVPFHDGCVPDVRRHVRQLRRAQLTGVHQLRPQQRLPYLPPRPMPGGLPCGLRHGGRCERWQLVSPLPLELWLVRSTCECLLLYHMHHGRQSPQPIFSDRLPNLQSNTKHLVGVSCLMAGKVKHTGLVALLACATMALVRGLPAASLQPEIDPAKVSAISNNCGTQTTI